MKGVTEWKESVASVYIPGEFAPICFSLQWCSHTFLGGNLKMQAEGSPHRYPPLHLWKGCSGLGCGTLCSVPGPKWHLVTGMVPETVGGLAEPSWAPVWGDGGVSPAWGSWSWAHSRSLWLQHTLPLRLRILPSVLLALTM